MLLCSRFRWSGTNYNGTAIYRLSTISMLSIDDRQQLSHAVIHVEASSMQYVSRNNTRPPNFPRVGTVVKSVVGVEMFAACLLFISFLFQGNYNCL